MKFFTCRCEATTKWFRESLGCTFEFTLQSGEVVRGVLGAVAPLRKRPHPVEPRHMHQSVELMLESSLGSRWFLTDNLKDVKEVARPIG